MFSDDEILVRAQLRARGKLKSNGVLQLPAAEIHSRCAAIVKFNPFLFRWDVRNPLIGIGIGDRRRLIHDFVDDDLIIDLKSIVAAERRFTGSQPLAFVCE